MVNRFITRPLSYSQLSAWEYDKEDWYNRYILNIPFLGNPATAFGSVVGDSIGTPNSLVPNLVPPGVKEYELSATLGAIRVIGFADHFCPKTKVLHENTKPDIIYFSSLLSRESCVNSGPKLRSKTI